MNTRPKTSPVKPSSNRESEILTDVGAICEALRVRIDFGFDTHLESVRLARLWAGRKGRISCEYVLTLRHGGTQIERLIQAGLDGAVAGVGSTGAANLSGRWLENVCLRIGDGRLTLLSPDCDNTLPSPAHVAREVAAQLQGDSHHLIARCDPDRPVSAELISYRANKRYVLRTNTLDARCNRKFIKVLRRPASAESFRHWIRTGHRLSSITKGRFGMPRLLAVDPDRRWFVIEGRESGSRPFGYGPRDAAEAARLLALLHKMDIIPGKTHNLNNELDVLRRWAPVMESLGRLDTPRIRAVIADLSARMIMLEPSEPVLVHRDFYASQLIAEGERTWLLDYDTFAAGDPEVDVATYVSHLVLDRLIEGDATVDAHLELQRFADIYRAAGGRLSEPRLRFYAASALARMAAIHGQRGLDSRTLDTLWGVVFEVISEEGLGRCRDIRQTRRAV
ncbi:MAG: hypothetical protein H6818_00930 [Phycisphaerales bacterium]|nr:hypothetical protein [Phycisphaerales bacterium]